LIETVGARYGVYEGKKFRTRLAQELGVAAALSGDGALWESLQSQYASA
jgi:hypothetical protein